MHAEAADAGRGLAEPGDRGDSVPGGPGCARGGAEQGTAARPHSYDGFGISFWTYVEPDPDRTPTAADCSAMLVDLHAVLRTYPGELPMLCATDVPRGLALLDEAGDVLTDAEADLLRTAAERLSPFLAAPGTGLQPLHGDAHPGNMVATRDGLMWIDFEDVCRGPVEWDLASMMDADAVTAHHRPDPEALARCTELRALQVALALVVFYDDFGDMEGWTRASAPCWTRS